MPASLVFRIAQIHYIVAERLQLLLLPLKHIDVGFQVVEGLVLLGLELLGEFLGLRRLLCRNNRLCTLTFWLRRHCRQLVVLLLLDQVDSGAQVLDHVGDNVARAVECREVGQRVLGLDIGDHGLKRLEDVGAISKYGGLIRTLWQHPPDRDRVRGAQNSFRGRDGGGTAVVAVAASPFVSCP